MTLSEIETAIANLRARDRAMLLTLLLELVAEVQKLEARIDDLEREL